MHIRAVPDSTSMLFE